MKKGLFLSVLSIVTFACVVIGIGVHVILPRITKDSNKKTYGNEHHLHHILNAKWPNRLEYLESSYRDPKDHAHLICIH